ncbi:MAG: hypothetical protein KDK96_12190, partial [Chlamydiia bacterium]|nr:hypothetical protein [Chlamydiia bacterium]
SFIDSSTTYTDYFKWVTEAETPEEGDQRLGLIVKHGIATDLKDLADKSMAERFVSVSPEKSVETETALMISESVFKGLESELHFTEANPFKEEKKEASDSDDSIGSDKFSWVQEVSLKPSSSKEAKDDDFIRWISGTNFSETDHIKMNCVQGVVYYLGLKNPEKGQQLRKQIGDYYSNLLAALGKEEAEKALFENLPSFLGFDIDGDSDNQDETGPHNFVEFDTMMQQGLIDPYTIISFGNNRGDVHMVIVTEDLKIRSLWMSPETKETSKFGKYEPRLVFKQVEEILCSLSSNTKEHIGIENDTFYMSTRFTIK